MAVDWGIVLGVVSVIGIPAGTGVGVAMAARTPGQFQFARYCFAAAGCLTILAWAWFTEGYELGLIRIALTAVVGAITALAVVLVWNWVFQLEAQEIPKKAAISLSASCHQEMLPKTLGPNEIINTLDLFPLPLANGGGGLAELSNHSGKEWQWQIQEGLFGGTASKCEITNYGDAPVLDIRLELDLSFYEAVPVEGQQNAISIGPLVLRRPWLIYIQKMDIGTANQFVFYICNTTENRIATVLFSKTVELRRMGESERRVATLDVPMQGGEIPIQFWPIRRPINGDPKPSK